MLTVTLPKDTTSKIEFSIDCRSVTLWQTIYFQWNGKRWVIDDTIFKEVDGKQVYVQDLRPNSPFAADVAFEKANAAEMAAAKEKAEKEEAGRRTP